jgi:hypothetical protein
MSIKLVVTCAAVLGLSASVAMAQSSSGAAAGAAAGAAGGAVVGGPVGAAVGGVTGAVVGGLTGPDQTRVKEYIVKEHHPSVKVQENVAVGSTLPSSVKVYEVPSSVGVKTTYRYAVVNDRTVLVDPSSHKVVQIIE